MALEIRVMELKDKLDPSLRLCKQEMLKTVAALSDLGSLSPDVLRTTKIGLKLTELSKSEAVDETVRMSAKELVSRWRQDYWAGSVTTQTPQKRKFESPSEAPEVAL